MRLAVVAAIALGTPAVSAPLGASASLRPALAHRTGCLVRLETTVEGRRHQWLSGPVRLQVRNEATGVTAEPAGGSVTEEASGVTVQRQLGALSLALHERWMTTKRGLAWEMEFAGEGARAGHEVVVEFRILSPHYRVFTPSERGVMSVGGYPDYTAPPYASVAWSSGRCYVLPLVSVLDGDSDTGLTIALPADANIPHLQVEWSGAKVLRLRLGHRAMGGGQPSSLRLLFYAHPADYRSALRCYSDDFPRYFEPRLARGPYEGAFWYHHIQDHPDFDEMAQQDVRFIWASFWFTYLGEYLPAESEWFPYTYAKWWKLQQTMADGKINAFIREMHEHHIGTFAYFNVTEHGGAGGETGGSEAASRQLRGPLADALVRDANGNAIATWEGAMVVNPGPRYSLLPVLQEQIRRHLTRLPELDGFCIDRLDWASAFDWGHQDGLTMVGGREVENLAGPVSKAVREVCREAHAAGKRVYVNQFYRVEVLRDVDGYCHECDYARGLGYLSLFRPASAWHQQKPYSNDLLPFEAQLKTRLQVALFPQMIAHQFPISQQGPNAKAADMLEVYAPLFSQLHGKRQVLLPHCVSVTGPNDVNLFVNGQGRYVAPITSRVRFLSRGGGPAERVMLTLRVPDAAGLKWARVYSADGRPYRAHVRRGVNETVVEVARHTTASMVVVGRGAEPAASPGDKTRLPGARASSPALPLTTRRPTRVAGVILKLTGAQVGADGPVAVMVDGRKVGEAANRVTKLPLGTTLPRRALEVRLVSADEGTWLAVERVQLMATSADGKGTYVADWVPSTGAATGRPEDLRLQLEWCPPREVPKVAARFAGRDGTTHGGWPGKFGSVAAWIPAVKPTPSQGGYTFEVGRGQVCVWAESTNDRRVLRADPANGQRRSTCWFADSTVSLSVAPPDANPYRLTVYVLDYDRNQRAMEVALAGEPGDLDAQQVTVQETDVGAYFTWTVTGPVTIEARKKAGHNAVISGVFIDPA